MLIGSRLTITSSWKFESPFVGKRSDTGIHRASSCSSRRRSEISLTHPFTQYSKLNTLSANSSRFMSLVSFMFRCSLCISRRCAVHGGTQGRRCGCWMGRDASPSCAPLSRCGRSCGFAVRGLRYRMTRRRAGGQPILARITRAHPSCGVSWLLRVWESSYDLMPPFRARAGCSDYPALTHLLHGTQHRLSVHA